MMVAWHFQQHTLITSFLTSVPTRRLISAIRLLLLCELKKSVALSLAPSRRKRQSISPSKIVRFTFEHEFDLFCLVYCDPHAKDFKMLPGRLFLQGGNIASRVSAYVENSLSRRSGGPGSAPLNCPGVDRLVLPEGLCHDIKRAIYNRAGKARSERVGQHHAWTLAGWIQSVSSRRLGPRPFVRAWLSAGQGSSWGGGAGSRRRRRAARRSGAGRNGAERGGTVRSGAQGSARRRGGLGSRHRTEPPGAPWPCNRAPLGWKPASPKPIFRGAVMIIVSKCPHCSGAGIPLVS